MQGWKWFCDNRDIGMWLLNLAIVVKPSDWNILLFENITELLWSLVMIKIQSSGAFINKTTKPSCIQPELYIILLQKEQGNGDVTKTQYQHCQFGTFCSSQVVCLIYSSSNYDYFIFSWFQFWKKLKTRYTNHHL